jgi:hypothetical protein
MRVPVGGVVDVTDTTRVTMKGKLVEVANDAVRLRIGADVLSA